MATEVEFHTGVAEPIGFACRLLRKASRLDAKLVCTAPPATLDALDRALWTFDERDFVPHVRVPGVREAMAERTPIWLALSAEAAGPAATARVLVNLDADLGAEAHAFARVIEVVADAEAQVERGRARWRAYQAAGLGIRHHAKG